MRSSSPPPLESPADIVKDLIEIGIRGRSLRLGLETYYHHGTSSPGGRRDLRALETSFDGQSLDSNSYGRLVAVCESLGLPHLYADAAYLPSTDPKHPMHKWRVAVEFFKPNPQA